VSRIYASLPFTGPAARLGRDVLRGARLALEARGGAELVALDSFGEHRDEQALANARRAAADGGALAYIGDFHSSQVLETAPVLGEAGLLQVAPVATFAGLRGPTLVRLMPHDGVGAAAIADWLVDAEARELLVVHDHDPDYGFAVGAMCVGAARDRGLTVRSRPIWDADEPWADDVRAAGAVLYVGVAGSGAVALWRDLHAHDPGMWLLGTEGVAEAWLARELDAATAERTRFFVAHRAPFAFYGYEAMALVLDCIVAGGGDRPVVTQLARSTSHRDSILGRYSIDEDGHTTATAYGRLAVVDGALVWDEP
jgi:ABC-type branched-subunit amino acid transport system substrate-binding protein